MTSLIQTIEEEYEESPDTHGCSVTAQPAEGELAMTTVTLTSVMGDEWMRLTFWDNAKPDKVRAIIDAAINVILGRE